MKIYLIDEYELENNRLIKNKIKRIFPNIKISFAYSRKDMAKVMKKKRDERYLDEKYLKSQNEKAVNNLINYYSNVKKLQEIYWKIGGWF